MKWPRTFYLHLCLRCHEMYYGEEVDRLAACPICEKIDQVRCQAIERYLKQMIIKKELMNEERYNE